jgi:glycosyltransferase involved in cell wall biosynthesis
MSRISVVIPTYNRAHILESVVKSVVNQNFLPSEIIIVDDGSKDGTEEVAKALTNKNEDINIRYIYQENQGGNVARNRGIQEAKGDYIAFLDSDDTWDREKLEKQLAVFEINDKIGAVYCGLRHIDLDKGTLIYEPKRSYLSGDLGSTLLIRDLTAPTSCYMVKRSVFEEVGGFDVNLKARQDWEMWIRIAQKYEIGVVPEALVNYGEHTGTRTASNPQKEIDAYRYIRNKYKVEIQSMPLSNRLKALSAYYRRMGKVYRNYKGNIIAAALWFMKALCVWPFSMGNWISVLGLLSPLKLRIAISKLWNGFFGKSKFTLSNH